ncbi:helix-turn-helix domain-containing protein [Reichenbachiella versicolor]|uniref:helix-turn-helix domain-containing protein n=1 Tax=Reichenbachiella versicolor TaxID=1821036 RepID=UPI000D6E186C|nr:helix-turn-helix transcriptional regulator [Reichenbachiella versicolor]
MDHDQEYITAFGQHLKRLRLEAGLTQEQLARDSNIDFTQVGRYERGVRSPSLTSLKKLAVGLKLHPKALLDFDYLTNSITK